MTKKKKQKVFITGGAGFIGQAVSRYFLRQGFDVVTFDIAPPRKGDVGSRVTGSVMYVDELERAMRGCDFVVHLAAMLGVKRTEYKRMQCLNVNINGTRNVFDACVKAGVKKIIIASSSEVYGEPIRTPIDETHPVFPKSVYAVTKLVAEEYARAYHNDYGLDYTVVRFFNVYGPGQVAEFVLPRFVRSALDGKPLTVNGDGGQVRSFCYVDDAARGVYLALTGKETNGKTFNIGNDRNVVSMRELAEKIIGHAGRKNVKIQYVKMDNVQADRFASREIVNRIPDISRARKVLGYKPKIMLDDGIVRTIKSGNIPTGWAELN